VSRLSDTRYSANGRKREMEICKQQGEIEIYGCVRGRQI